MFNFRGTLIETQPSARALLPLLVFLALFIGTGTWLTLQGVEFAFYQLPAPVAALPAVMLALVLGKEGFNKNLETFFKGVGDSNIMAMCLIYLLAGAFATVAKATGGVDATVALASPSSPRFLLPGLFLISAFIATAMGTSMGTIGAVAPVALGVAQAAGIDPVLMAGTILSGATFGDNLSIISDTTIAATRSQGCEMKDKFRENFKIAAPAAIGLILLYLTLGLVGDAPRPPEAHVELLKVMPYLLILGLALLGMNVFMVLGLGILAAGGVGLLGITPSASSVRISIRASPACRRSSCSPC